MTPRITDDTIPLLFLIKHGLCILLLLVRMDTLGVCIYIMICIVLLALSDQYSSKYVYSLLIVLPGCILIRAYYSRVCIL